MKSKKKAGSKRNILSSKETDDTYVMKTNNHMKILRIILWVILGFIFIRGVIVCLHPDKTAEINRLISNFKTEFYSTQNRDYEVLGFTENFVQEYLTYEIDGRDSFYNRIAPYVSDRVESMEDIYDFKNACEATAVQAYKIEKVSKSQVDVFVKAKVTYSSQDDTGVSKKIKTIMLRVPVYLSDSGYIVEDLPIFVNDTMKTGDYKYEDCNGEEVDSSKYEKSVINFLKAYYGADQNVVDYYLAADADKSKFYCLGGCFEIQKINDIKAYEEKEGILCTVAFKIADATNGAILCQNLNLLLIHSDGRLYIKDINTRIGNLKED